MGVCDNSGTRERSSMITSSSMQRFEQPPVQTSDKVGRRIVGSEQRQWFGRRERETRADRKRKYKSRKTRLLSLSLKNNGVK